MAIRFMLDSDVLDDLQGHAAILATYSDLVPDPAELRKRFPHSEIVLIDRGLGDPSGEASVADVETGALTIGDAPSWYDRKHAAGVKYLTIYCNRSNIAAINQAMGDRAFFHWEATLDGTVAVPMFNPLHTPAAVQCFSAAMLGIHADGSLVLEDNWHPQPGQVQMAIVKRDLSLAISQLAGTQSELHRMAAALGG